MKPRAASSLILRALDYSFWTYLELGADVQIWLYPVTGCGALWNLKPRNLANVLERPFKPPQNAVRRRRLISTTTLRGRLSPPTQPLRWLMSSTYCLNVEELTHYEYTSA